MERIYTEPSALHNITKAIPCKQHNTTPYTVKLNTKAKAFSGLGMQAATKPATLTGKWNSTFAMRKFILSAKTLAVAVILLLALGSSTQLLGQTNTWDGSSSVDWNTAANWSLNLVPTSAHDVVIPDNFNVTVNTAAVCKTFTINSGGSDNTITISLGQSLTVTGAISIGGGTNNDTKIINVGANSLTCASVTISNTVNDNSDSEITISTGTVTVTGSIAMNGSSLRNAIRFSDAGKLYVGGNMSGGTLIASIGTIECDGSSSQTIAGYTYYKLIINNSAGVALAAATTISNLLTMASGTLDMANTNLTVGSLTGSGDITNITGTPGNRTFTIGSDNTSPAAYTGTINNGTATQVTVTKTGTGTLTLAGTGDNVGLAVTGSAGTVVLAKTSNSGVHATGGGGVTTNGGIVQLGGSGGDQMYDGSYLTMNGGTFSTGATSGFSETITGTLILNATSTIALATGVHTLAFENSSAAAWGAFTLTITGWTGGYDGTASATAGRIFFGTDATGLTAGQLAKIRFFDGTTNYRAVILSTGELVPTTSTYYARANAVWNVNTTWSFTSGGAAVDAGLWPGAGDIVLIGDAGTARAVTIPGGYTANCASIAIGNSSNNTANSLTLSAATSVLNVSGDITINRANGANTNALNVNAGNAIVNGSVTFAGTNTGTGRVNTVVITTGTLSISGDLVFVAGIAATNVLAMNGGAGTLNLGGSWTGTVGTFTEGTTSTFVYNGTSPQTVNAAFGNYNHLKIDNAAGVSLSAATTIAGLLTMADGTLNMANNNLTVGSLTGSGNITNTTGTAGARAIAIGSDNTNPAAYTGIISNGTATSVALTKSGTGTLILSGANTFTGTTTITAGTLRLGTSGVLADGSPVTLSGGTLNTGSGAGFSETIGAVTLSATSTIALGTGVHTLTIANSSAATWGAFTLNITGWTGTGGDAGSGTGGKIMVGTGGLTAAQLLKVTFSGYTAGAVITSSGELVPARTTYYSNGSNAPNLTSSWKPNRDGTGTSPVNFTSGNVFVVQNGHSMTTSAVWSVSGTGSAVIIESGGTLQANHTVTLATATYFQIKNGGAFIQNVALAMSTTILQGTEVFGASSNFEVRVNPTSTTQPSSPGYGNFTLNVTTGATAYGWSGNLTTIQGNLTVLGTGTGTTSHALCAAAGNIIVNVGGNFTMTGGNLWFSSGTSTCTMNVTGNVSVSGSSTVLNLANSSGVGTLNVSGDFSHTTGSITEGGTTTTSTIVFNGTTEQTYTSGGTVASIVNFTVSNGATLNMGTSVLGKGSSGTFTIANGGTLITANELGITSSGDGSILVNGTRTYNTGANYIYSGAAVQVTGNGLTGANTLTIDNSFGVSLSGSVAVTTLDLKQGSLSIGSYTLTLNGTVSGNGTLTGDANSVLVIGGTTGGNLGTINFTGGTGTLKTFTVNRTGTTPSVTLGSNLTVSAGSGGGTMEITSGVLTLQSGKWLTVDGTLANSTSANFIIESGSSVIQKSSGVNATLKRYIEAAQWGTWDDGWHFLSSPVTAQAISTGGFTTSGAGNDYDFYAWYEPSNLWVNYKNTSVSPTWDQVNGNTNFTVGKGYMAAYQVTSTKEFSGTLNHLDAPIIGLTNNNTTANHSWNLLGNPYPAALTWDNTWSRTYVAGVCQIWDESINDYTSISSGGTIPALNGFMVEVTAVSPTTGSITIPATKQTHAVNTWYKSTASEGQLKLTVMAQDNSSGKEAFIQLNPESTELFDLEYDGHYLRGYGPVFYSIAGTDTLSVNTLPAFNESLIIPLVFQKNEGADYVLTVSGVENFEVPIYLTDKKTGVIQNLGYNPVYSFSSAEGDNINRFTLSFKSPTSIKEETEEKFTVSVVNGVITLQSDQSLTGTVKVSDMLGRTVAMENMAADSPLQINLNSTPGVYVVSVYTKSKTYSQKVVIR